MKYFFGLVFVFLSVFGLSSKSSAETYSVNFVMKTKVLICEKDEANDKCQIHEEDEEKVLLAMEGDYLRRSGKQIKTVQVYGRQINFEVNAYFYWSECGPNYTAFNQFINVFYQGQVIRSEKVYRDRDRSYLETTIQPITLKSEREIRVFISVGEFNT